MQVLANFSQSRLEIGDVSDGAKCFMSHYEYLSVPERYPVNVTGATWLLQTECNAKSGLAITK